MALLPLDVNFAFVSAHMYINHCYYKTLFFRRILISQFSYLENLLHFSLVDFPFHFINQFVFCFFWCLYQILL